MIEMRDRLIELLDEAKYKALETIGSLNNGFAVWYADYLLAAGVIVPPCKVGDVAYHLTSIDTLNELNVAEIFKGEVSSVVIEDTLCICCCYDGLSYWYTETDIGKSLFLTREEAERALAERRKG